MHMNTRNTPVFICRQICVVMKHFPVCFTVHLCTVERLNSRSNGATPAPIVLMLQEVPLPLEPIYNNIIGYADIFDDMHFEIEFTIHSWPSGDWASIFQCGTANMERYPGLFLHPYSGVDGNANEGLYVMVSDGNGNNVGGLMGDALDLYIPYHVVVDWTQSWFTVVVNDETLYDGAKNGHTASPSMPCYSGWPQHIAADVTITALTMWSTRMFIRFSSSHSSF